MGFTINSDFILCKWRLKRKHSPAKCAICATEIRRLEIRLKAIDKILAVQFSVKQLNVKKNPPEQSIKYNQVQLRR